jgi:hypothetical protein
VTLALQEILVLLEIQGPQVIAELLGIPEQRETPAQLVTPEQQET